MEEIIEKTMIGLAVNTQDMFKFAYQLRRLDKGELYTRKFFEPVFPNNNILVDIFCSNKWVVDGFNEGKMEADPNSGFKITIGKNNCLKM